MHDREEAIRVIRGMALIAAAKMAVDKGVRHPSGCTTSLIRLTLKLRVFIGQRSTVVVVPGFDVAQVARSEAVSQKLEQQKAAAQVGIAK